MLTFKYMAIEMEGAVGRPWWRLVPAFLVAAIGLHAASPSELAAAELKPKTVQAFNQYVALAESRMKRDESHPNDFLYIESLPKSEYESIMNTLRKGDVYVQQIDMHAPGKDPVEVPDGMIHHWVGDVFIPGKSVTSALDILRDYDNFKNIYNPEVVRSRLVGRDDKDDYRVYMRLQKKSVVTVTLDTWYNIHFTPIGNDSGYSRSVSTRIQQVDDAGTPHEHLEPVGRDSGYLWRITSYWRYQKRDNGVIVEWESISLSRDVPFLVAWFVDPLIRKIAREAVTDMLTETRKAVLTEKRQNQQATSTP